MRYLDHERCLHFVWFLMLLKIFLEMLTFLFQFSLLQLNPILNLLQSAAIYIVDILVHSI